MYVFGIETSCDETAAAVVKGGRNILSNVIASQHDLHGKFGGVVPELASRRHVEIIDNIAQQALDEASLTWQDIDLIAVTQGPGLVGSLIIGIAFAHGVSYRFNIPLIGINHLEGHLMASLIEQPDTPFPVIALIVSGGHTMLVKMDAVSRFEILGQTRDDAAGEAFDKVAMMMNLGYPGGPVLSRLAATGSAQAIAFPRGMIRSHSFEFSFSGLKTSVLHQLKKETHPITSQRQADIAASFQEAVVDVLVQKTIRAAKKYHAGTITIGGGVARNPRLREKMAKKAHDIGCAFIVPEPDLCSDNAAMIAALGYYHRANAHTASNDSLDPKPSMRLIPS